MRDSPARAGSAAEDGIRAEEGIGPYAHAGGIAKGREGVIDIADFF